MDEDLYKAILELKKGRRMDTTKRKGFTETQMKMRVDMAANKAAWYGHFFPDLWMWTRNTNPLLALWFSHRLHPINKLERHYILMLQILLFAYIAILITELDDCDAWHEKHPFVCAENFTIYYLNPDLIENIKNGKYWESVQLSANYTPEYRVDEYCCSAGNLVLLKVYDSFKLSNTAVAEWIPIVGLSAFLTALTIVLSQVWFLLAGCQCCQESRHRTRWEFLGHVILFLFGLAPLTYIVWLMTFIIDEMQFGETLLRFLLVKFLSIAGTTIVQTLVFILLWTSDMKGSRNHFNVTVEDLKNYLTHHDDVVQNEPESDAAVVIRNHRDTIQKYRASTLADTPPYANLSQEFTFTPDPNSSSKTDAPTKVSRLPSSVKQDSRRPTAPRREKSRLPMLSRPPVPLL